MTIAVAAGRVAQRFWRTAPMNETVGANIFPGEEALPDSNPAEAQWEAHIAGSGKSTEIVPMLYGPPSLYPRST